MGKKTLTIILLAVMAMSFAACGKKRTVTNMDLEYAQFKLEEYCKTFPGNSYNTADNLKYQTDVTNDGNPDIVTDVTYGSGISKTVVAVYDVANDTFYVLDGSTLSYYIEGFENNKLVVVESDVAKGVDRIKQIQRTTGTIKLKKGELIFVAD